MIISKRFIAASVSVCLLLSGFSSSVSAYSLPFDYSQIDFTGAKIRKALEEGLSNDEILEKLDDDELFKIEYTIKEGSEKVIEYGTTFQQYTTKKDIGNIVNNDWVESYVFVIGLDSYTREERVEKDIAELAEAIDLADSDMVRIYIVWNTEMSRDDIKKYGDENTEIFFISRFTTSTLCTMPKSYVDKYIELYRSDNYEILYMEEALSDDTATPSDNLSTGVVKEDKGDINSDGKTDITDLTELSLALLGDTELTETQLQIADIDGDGAVKLTDLAKFRQFLSKQISSL